MIAVRVLHGRWSKFGVLAATVVVAAGVLAACDPVLHPGSAIKEQAGFPVAFQALSGNGQFVVVRSTGAGATVPGAGCWRVSRADGSFVQLPSCDHASISDDGSRVGLTSGSTFVLWSSGTTLTPPIGLFSKDLTFEVFRDTDGTIKTWSSADQSVTPVETAFPRPAGTTAADPGAISNDGRTVEYFLQGTSPIERFVDLDTNTKIDRPHRSSERFFLAASGNGFLDASGGSWAELVALPSGSVVRRYTNTSQESIVRWFVADDGASAWVHQEREEILGSDCASGPPPAFSCVVASHAVFFNKLGARTFDTGAKPVDAMDIFGNGRFLWFDKFTLPQGVLIELRGPVTILDWMTGQVERLTAAGTYTQTNSLVCSAFQMTAPCTVPASSTHASMSNDLSLVATATNTGNGWLEYTTSP